MGNRVWKFVFAVCVICLPLTLAASGASAAEVTARGSALSWVGEAAGSGASLTVTGPGDLVFRRSFGAGVAPEMPLFDKAGYSLPDGTYAWELRWTPAVSPSIRAALKQARAEGNDAADAALKERGLLPEEAKVESGYFTMAGGALLDESGPEEQPTRALKAGGSEAGGTEPAGPGGGFTEAVVLTNSDGVIRNSLCVGFDCATNEVFGFDTIRLKENSTRIKFEDTSVGSFPTTDWQLTANDSASGGANKFSIEEIDGAKIPFTVRAGARTNSIFVDSSGRVGLGTATPVVSLHVVNGNTPTLRLDQDSSSGFTPQVWDVAGNEASFFIRDVTAGSRLPFRIRPGAPSSALTISPTGAIGVGTLSPVDTGGGDVALHILRTNGEAQLFVEENSTTETARNLLDLENNGIVQMRFQDDSPNGDTWQMSNADNGFNISKQGSGVVEFDIRDNGDIFVSGNLVHSSSRAMKDNFSAIDPQDVLAQVSQLPITAWSFKRDPGTKHVGPMAEDFYQAFGLGTDAQHIAVTDSSGIALAAIQALNQKVDEKDELIRRLEERLAALEARQP